LVNKKLKKEIIIKAINEFFNIFSECNNIDFDRFYIDKLLKNEYSVRLIIDGKDYLHVVKL